jgi:hypothetical protein
MNDNQLRKEIAAAINRVSAENGSNTPDFILAEYLTDCLVAFDKAVKAKEKWYGKELYIGADIGMNRPDEKDLCTEEMTGLSGIVEDGMAYSIPWIEQHGCMFNVDGDTGKCKICGIDVMDM